MILAVVAIVCTLIIVVGVHEAGHAIAANFFGVKIKRISIGFGRPLFLWRKKSGLEWVWALWPFGGSVYLLNSRNFPVDPDQYPQCFDKRPIWVRIGILLAGSFANLLTAWFAFVLVFLLGISYRLPIIQTVEPGSIAAKAGVTSGDQFVAIGKEPTISWRQVGMQLVVLWGQKDVSITVRTESHNALKTLHVDLSQVPFAGKDTSLLTTLGLKPNSKAPKALLRFSSVTEAIAQANNSMLQQIYLFLMILKQLIIGVIPFSILLGPIGFFAELISSFMQGVSVFLYFIASLSMAVAVVNLLPIPVLDGGSIVYAIIEKIRKKPVSIALELLIHRLFLIVFIVLLVQLISNDLVRIYS